MKHHHVSRTIFSFFGPPGSGKGTLAQKLSTLYHFQVLSTGNLCREHVAAGSDFGKMLDHYLKNGQLIPDELITDMVIDWLKKQEKRVEPIILDGFPRTQGQASRFLDYLKVAEKAYGFRVVIIEVPDDEIVRRLSQRVVCSNKQCQASFTGGNDLTNCKLCGSPLTTRHDDKEEVVRARLAFYPDYRDALLSFYHKIGQKVEKLDIAQLSPDGVFERFCSMFKQELGGNTCDQK